MDVTGKIGRGVRATILDVAARAGVSIKTVSRVFNAEPNVREETRDKVIAAAQEIDYHPNVAARGLAGKRSFLIGMVHGNPSPYYVADLNAGVLDRLRGEPYRLLVLPFESASTMSGKVLAMARSSGLDGLILSPPLGDDPTTIAELTAAGFPFVRIAPASATWLTPEVRMDDVAAAQDITEYLIGLGHRRIAIIRGDPSHPSGTARLIGYRKAMRRAGLDIDPMLVEEGLYTFDSGIMAARRLLASRTRPSAIFACNDDMAAGALFAANEMGLKVPDKLSLAGFDDTPIASIVWPRLTTISQPTVDMARAATAALLALLDDKKEGGRITMPYRLVVRGSTAPPG